jgi:hypothetical protein
VFQDNRLESLKFFCALVFVEVRTGCLDRFEDCHFATENKPGCPLGMTPRANPVKAGLARTLPPTFPENTPGASEMHPWRLEEGAGCHLSGMNP